MPSYLPPRLHSFSQHGEHKSESERDQEQHVFVTSEAEVAEIHHVVTNHSAALDKSPHLAEFEKYVRDSDQAGSRPLPLSVCFKNVTTYGHARGSSNVKTLGKALWRTLTLQDIYEATVKKLSRAKNGSDGFKLIRDFSGVVRNGEMML